jgi:hypothetical protein
MFLRRAANSSRTALPKLAKRVLRTQAAAYQVGREHGSRSPLTHKAMHHHPATKRSLAIDESERQEQLIGRRRLHVGYGQVQHL